jgi:hypothetical protein
MALTPQITLTATLLDLSGSQAGSTSNPAILRVALAGFGLTLPCVPGTANLALIGPEDYPDNGSGQITVELWGNDVINPSTTYYAITLLDGNGNIVQTGAYKFTGTQTIDLSNAPQIYPTPPISPTLTPVYTDPPGAATQSIDGSIIIDGNLTVTGSFNFGFSVVDLTIGGGGSVVVNLQAGSIFYLLLTENVTITLDNPQPGQSPVFFIQQNGTGNWTVTWPASVLNPIEPVNPVANGKTTQTLYTWPDNTFMQPGYYP